MGPARPPLIPFPRARTHSHTPVRTQPLAFARVVELSRVALLSLSSPTLPPFVPFAVFVPYLCPILLDDGVMGVVRIRWFGDEGDDVPKPYWFGARKPKFKLFMAALLNDFGDAVDLAVKEGDAHFVGWTGREKLLGAIFIDQMVRNRAALSQGSPPPGPAIADADAVALRLACSVDDAHFGGDRQRRSQPLSQPPSEFPSASPSMHPAPFPTTTDAADRKAGGDGGDGGGDGSVDTGSELVRCSAPELCFFSLVLRHARTPSMMARSRALLEAALGGNYPGVAIATVAARALAQRFVEETDELVRSIAVDRYIAQAMSTDEPSLIAGANGRSMVART